MFYETNWLQSAGKYLMQLLCCTCCCGAIAQTTVTGVVSDASSGETLIGAAVVEKGTTNGVVTDIDGNFALTVNKNPPFVLVVSFVGFETQEVSVQNSDKPLRIKMGTSAVVLKQAEVIGDRISDKQKQSALTVESMDVIAIKEAPSGDFYESLGTLKGVDMTAASMGFKVINTRGFNSTSPVRSLQLIDGVDNQSPGLNFSLGNFLGASDLDVMKVDIIAGASSAFYGPGAFNGVINMQTKSPWLFPGTSAFIKAGERNLMAGAIRHAQVFKDKEGHNRWAFKLNAYAMRANDWEAENYDPTIDSRSDQNTPGGYDAINIYGDEDVTSNNEFFDDPTNLPGLGIVVRNGYRETDLVDYDAENFKLGASFHYLLRDSLEVVASSNYSTGSTVYQGDNRYRLEGVQFYQHKLQIGHWDDWFIRGYVTHEDAGQTFDIYTTALRLQDQAGSTQEWNTQYGNLWASYITPIVQNHPDYITVSQGIGMGWTSVQMWQDSFYNEWLSDNVEFLTALHNMAKDSVNSLNNSSLRPFLAPGTAAFDEAYADITSRDFTEGGSRFFDRSLLWHLMGEKKLESSWGEVTVGGNFRSYSPNSGGTIFRDTGNVVIRNTEYGAYAGLTRAMMNDHLKGTATLRMDKNENFNMLFSPAASFVYTSDTGHVFRLSVSSAIRNPTLADQFLYYNVGRAILLGNIDGQFESGKDSLITIDSFVEYISTGDANLLSNTDKLEFLNVDRIRPEQVRTIELGYRGRPWKDHYIDLGYYHSWYRDFIGFVIGVNADLDPTTGFPIGGLSVFRVAANSTQIVRTQGFDIGWNYYRKKTMFSANYSWNKLISGEDDPIIPAFNTPEHKFNIGVTGHEFRIPFTTRRQLGFGVNYKYIEGFVFEGSPQFTGFIPSYDMVDAQVTLAFPKQNTSVKLGVSNLFGVVPLFDKDIDASDRLNRAVNNDVYLVFGGPRVGRLCYLQVTYEFNDRP